MGLAIPLFSQYSQNQRNSINALIREKLLYPWVPMIVVLNPGCLPGNLSNPNIKSEVKSLQAGHPDKGRRTAGNCFSNPELYPICNGNKVMQWSEL
jgi:hypothetical protein